MATLPSGALALLHCNGSNGSTTITNDVSGGLAFTASGAAALTTAQKIFGTAGIDFSTAPGYIQPGTSVNLTGDFAIIGWGSRTDYTGKLFCIGNEGNAGAMNLEHFVGDTNLKTTGGGTAITDSGAAFGQPGDGWRMWMVVRSGSTLRLAVEDASGNVQSLGTATDSTTYTGKVTFGDKILSGGTPEGATAGFWMDELVVLDGSPVYTSFPFSAETAEFTLPASTPVVTPFDQQTASVGGTATFSPSYSNSPTSYQWKLDGSNISGATSANYTTPTAAEADNGGFYSVIPSNGSGAGAEVGAYLFIRDIKTGMGRKMRGYAFKRHQLALTTPLMAARNEASDVGPTIWGDWFNLSGAPTASGASTATPAAGSASVGASGSSTAHSTATAAVGIATISASAGSSSKANATPADGAATVSATASSSANSAGSAAGIATVSAAAASVATTAATAAAGTATVSAAGASAAKTAATAADGVATVSGSGTGIVPTTATPAAGAATVSGVGSTSTDGQATASPASGNSTASAQGASAAETVATAAAGSATVSGVGSSFFATTAISADGSAAVSASGASTAAASGVAAGSGLVSGVGSSGAAGEATLAAGSSAVSGIGSSTAQTDAVSADGASIVSGVGSSTAAGEANAIPADGVATVSGIGSSTASADAIPAVGIATVSGATPSPIDYEAMAAAVWSFVLPNGKSAAETAVETLSLLETLSAAPGCLDVPIEGIFTGGDLLRVIAAVQAGKSTITSASPGTAYVEFAAVDGSDIRVAAEMDGSERTDVAITL